MKSTVKKIRRVSFMSEHSLSFFLNNIKKIGGLKKFTYFCNKERNKLNIKQLWKH